MKLIFGIKPTRIHIGHILSIFNFIKKEKYKSLKINIKDIYCLIGDIHKFASIESNFNIKQDIETIKTISSKLEINYYQQSKLPSEYFIMYHIISFFCKINDLNKVFKINYKNNTINNFAKFSYPVLMCNDIILLNPCTVLVGSDQIHNVRFIKNILSNIQKLYNLQLDIKFEIIDIKILSLNDNNKMSTSDKSNSGQIFLDMNNDEIYKIIMQAKTQSKMPKTYNELEDSTKNLYLIYSIIKNLEIEYVINIFSEKNFQEFKQHLYFAIVELFNFYKNLNNLNNKYDIHHIINNIIIKNFNLIYSTIF